VLQGIVTIWLVTLGVFSVLRLTGDPVSYMLPPDASKEDRARLIALYGFNDPLWKQYVVFNNNLLHGRFGPSLRWDSRDALEVFVSRLPATLALIAIPDPIVTVLYQRGAFDEAATKWQNAVEEYRRQKNIPSQIKVMTDLAAAYQALGQQRRALALLEEAVEIAVKSGDQKSIVLLTEYKNDAAFFGREKLFASILEHLPSSPPGVLRTAKREDLFGTVDTRVFQEVPSDASTQFKLLAKQ